MESGLINRRTTQHNLAQVLAQINREHWELSPLLIKAVSLHGEASQPPIRNRQTAAYKTLEEWVRRTMADNPQLAQKTPAAIPTEVKAAAGDVPPKEPAGNSDFASNKPAVSPSAPAAKAETAPLPMDPFDPAPFNQANKPSKTPPD
jgi:hypothetical protein